MGGTWSRLVYPFSPSAARTTQCPRCQGHTAGRIPRESLVFWMMVLFVVATTRSCQAAHSRRRVVVVREKERYDRVITEFSPDGRLSQVEYGMEAARRGSAIAAVLVEGDTKKDGDDNHSGVGIAVVVQNSSFGKVHRIDHHMWLITAGLSGDARRLATYLRSNCQNHRSQYGEAPTTEQVAKMAGEFQHFLTRSGGIRPLGCTALVVGIDPSAEEDVPGKPHIFQTDPGGIVEACSYCAAGKGRDEIFKEIGPMLDGDGALSMASFSLGFKATALNKKEGKRDKNSGNKIPLTAVAAKMAQTVLSKLDEPKKVDVWTIEPRLGKRGGMQAICYENVDKSSISKILGDLPQ